MIKELKKELSKLSGVDFFNPKFRDVFKKYFPDDSEKEDNSTAEEERLKEVIGDESEQTEKVSERQTEGDDPVNVSENENQVEDDVQSNLEQTEDSEIDNSEDTSGETEVPDSSAEGTQEPEAEQPSKDLIDTKVELELVKSGVREDRLEPAKRLIIPEIQNLEDLDKVKEMIKEFPEWLKNKEVNTKPFGMPVGESGSDLTEEEKRLKAMGIDPRN